MLIELQATLTFLASSSHAMDQNERLQYFSWSNYLIVGTVYSIFLFFDEVPKNHRVIFSQRNKRNLTQILTIHSTVVAVLLCALRICSYVVRYLPFWMTHEIDLGEGYVSFADLIFGLGALALFAYEQQLLVIATDGPGSVQE